MPANKHAAAAPPRARGEKMNIGGVVAILGMDIVSFSKFPDDDQIRAVAELQRWVREAMSGQGVGESQYRWSPAGDGGYLTFEPDVCEKAIDVAFAIAEKSRKADWRPREVERLVLRMALHAGQVREAVELGRTTNIWGIGINMTSRMVVAAAPGQLLVSTEYFGAYVKGKREREFEFGDEYQRTVKHRAVIKVMNADSYGRCLTRDQARDLQWQAIGGLWQETLTRYRWLVEDALASGDHLAALAAGKFLLELNEGEAVADLCRRVGYDERRTHPAHWLFGQIPPAALADVLRIAVPRRVKAGDVFIAEGDPADTVFFPVSGTVVVEFRDSPEQKRLAPGTILGEFSLWIPAVTRTASVRAKSDVLVLEFPKRGLKAVLETASASAWEAVVNTIRTRLTDGVRKSARLFPGDPEFVRRVTASVGCAKYPAGTVLDLTAGAYALFTGRVRLDAPAAGGPFELAEQGHYATVPILGLRSHIGTPDGPTATVLEDAVAVHFPAAVVTALLADPAIHRGWAGLTGERLFDLNGPR